MEAVSIDGVKKLYAERSNLLEVPVICPWSETNCARNYSCNVQHILSFLILLLVRNWNGKSWHLTKYLQRRVDFDLIHNNVKIYYVIKPVEFNFDFVELWTDIKRSYRKNLNLNCHRKRKVITTFLQQAINLQVMRQRIKPVYCNKKLK